MHKTNFLIEQGKFPFLAVSSRSENFLWGDCADVSIFIRNKKSKSLLDLRESSFFGKDA